MKMLDLPAKPEVRHHRDRADRVERPDTEEVAGDDRMRACVEIGGGAIARPGCTLSFTLGCGPRL
jgi:hypothetical protein